jgi:hypothetical protein
MGIGVIFLQREKFAYGLWLGGRAIAIYSQLLSGAMRLGLAEYS